MTKKKTVVPIKGVGRDPETQLTVQKSIPLFTLWQSDLSLSEFKILDTYLSRINSHQPDRRTVLFTKGELEQLVGVKKINKKDLTARLNSLGRFVDLQDGNSKKVHQVALFEEAYGEMDENGLWTVKLTCTQKAMKYIFNVEKLGYLRYKLHSIVSLKSRFAYVLFLYLEHNRFRKTWEIGVNELRQLLSCTEEFYDEFKYFNQRILKKCHKELTEKTDCRYTYTPVKTGRVVTGVRFTLETLADSIEPAIPGQLSLGDFNAFDIGDPDDPDGIYAAALPPEFSPEQVEALRQLAVRKVPYDPFGALPMECQIADYLAQKVAFMKAARTDVKHPYSYLRKMIEQDPDC